MLWGLQGDINSGGQKQEGKRSTHLIELGLAYRGVLEELQKW